MNKIFNDIIRGTKKFTYISICALALLPLTSCTDYLDKSPDSDISDVDAFKDFTNFQGFTEELYNCMPDFARGYWTNSFNWGDDEIINVGVDYHMGYKIDQGDFWGWQRGYDGWQSGWMDRNTNDPSGDRFKHSLWQLAWYGIRKANIGIANIDKFTGTQEEKNLIEGQLYFFRAWYHFELMQYFGGLPYISSVLPSGEKLTLPRLKYQECADLAAADFRKAADLLPVNWETTTAGKRTTGKNQLRITKITALAYLGKDLLWAGSPLMNKERTGDANYNKAFCERAAQAFGELLAIVEKGDTQYGLLPFSEYSNNFYTMDQNCKMPGESKDNSITEAILRTADYESGWAESVPLGMQYGSKNITDCGVCFMPTANYVNYYGMANGLPLDDPASGFDKTHPWKNRDPRFYNDIKYDGCQLVKGSMSATEEKFRYADLQTGGNLRNVIDGCRTGYLNYKFINVGFNKWDKFGGNWRSYSHQANINVPWMRLSDVYLMYAESAAEASGNTQGKYNCGLTALDAVNKIRERAGVEDVNAKFSSNLDGFMSELRRERAVELAFESHRFTDLRRWLLLDKSPYTIKTSQEFTRMGTYNTAADDYNPKDNQVSGYSEKLILTRNFTEKHYWMPLKKTDTNMYLDFKQNPGW